MKWETKYGMKIDWEVTQENIGIIQLKMVYFYESEKGQGKQEKTLICDTGTDLEP